MLDIFRKELNGQSGLNISESSIGKSFEGRDIIAFTLTCKNLCLKKASNSTRKFKNNILITGVHHAREVISATATLYIYEYIISHKNDKEIEDLLSQTVIWFIPILNIDGYNLIENEFNAMGSLNDDVRKNRRTFSECSKSFSIELDFKQE